jgi:hypothetical protein
VVFQQRYDTHEPFARTCRVAFNVAVEQRLQRMVEATAAKNFRKHDAIMLERKLIDEVNHLEDSLVLAKRYFMFSTEYGVNEDVNAIARKSDDRIAMSDLRWNGVSVMPPTRVSKVE